MGIPNCLCQKQYKIGYSHFVYYNDQNFLEFPCLLLPITKEVRNLFGEFLMKNMGKICGIL